jgi:hypothetical protein
VPSPAAVAAPRPELALIDPAFLPGGHGERSLFAFREKAPAIVVPSHHEALPAIAVVKSSDDGNFIKEKEKPPFPYRCIGRFGPEGAQLVAFIVDGEVKLARAGEVLEDKYLVRGVGIESVEVGLLSAPDVSWRLEFGK